MVRSEKQCPQIISLQFEWALTVLQRRMQHFPLFISLSHKSQIKHIKVCSFNATKCPPQGALLQDMWNQNTSMSFTCIFTWQKAYLSVPPAPQHPKKEETTGGKRDFSLWLDLAALLFLLLPLAFLSCHISWNFFSQLLLLSARKLMHTPLFHQKGGKKR